MKTNVDNEILFISKSIQRDVYKKCTFIYVQTSFICSKLSKRVQSSLRVSVLSLSVVPNFATLWTIARQAPLWDFPDKNTGVGCHFLL